MVIGYCFFAVCGDEFFPCSFSGGCVFPLGRTSLYNLFSIVHSEIESVFLGKSATEGFYRDDEYCLHVTVTLKDANEMRMF